MYRVSHVARELAANVAMGIPAVRAMRIRRGRTTGIPVANKARAIVAQFEFFMDSIGWDDLHGKTVVEIGPGDAIALAFLFLSAGAGRYVAVDRFLGDVAGPQALQLYDAVLEHAPPRLRASASVPGTQRSTAALLKSWAGPGSHTPGKRRHRRREPRARRGRRLHRQFQCLRAPDGRSPRAA